MFDDKIESISKVSSVNNSPGVDAANSVQSEMATKDRFDQAMTVEAKTVTPTLQVQAAPTSTQPSLFDQVRDMNSKNLKLNPDGLAVQTDELVSKIGKLKQSMQQPNLQLKSSTAELMNNKLEHIDNNLKVALSKAGVEVPQDGTAGKLTATDDATSKRINPIDRFLGFLTDGQSQLENLSTQLQGMTKEQISAPAMLTIQIKMGQISQEIDLFTSLLNKSLESIKTIMNVQV